MFFIIFIFGLIIGSFLNAYIFRLSPSPNPLPPGERNKVRGKSVWRGRSMCPKCKKQLSWYELIPLVSFIIQLGRCRGCKQKIDWQYPLVELAVALLFVLVFRSVSCSMYRIACIFTLAEYFYFVAILLILFVYDLRYGLIPDRVAIPGIIIAFLFNIILTLLSPGFHNWLLVIGYWLLAVAIGAGFFAIQYYGSRGRWVGAGDIRFGALMGAMIGWPQIFLALVVSYIIGGVVGATLLLSGQKKFGQTLPMGTFLAIGTIIALLWGNKLMEIYLSL